MDQMTICLEIVTSFLSRAYGPYLH